MDTEYTKGFKAGMAWQTEYVIRMLERHLCSFTDAEVVECWCGSFNEAIALIEKASDGPK